MSDKPTELHGFNRSDLASIAEGLEKGYPAEYNVGDECPEVESTTAYAARFIRASLAEQRDATPLPGWKMVPATPTQAMCQAGQDKAREWPRFPLRIVPIYQAMLAEVPSPPPDALTQPDNRPIGQFYPGMTAEESEQANEIYYAKERLAARMNAMRESLRQIDPAAADAYSDEQIGQLVQQLQQGLAAAPTPPALTDVQRMDAMRYRWLRDHWNDDHVIGVERKPAQLDQDVDDAMKTGRMEA